MCYPSEEMICEKEETAMKKTAAVLLSMLLVMGFTAVCSAERVDAPVKTGTEGENFVSLWSGDGGDVQVRRAGDRFDVYAVLQRQGRKGVAQIVEAHLGKPRPLQHPVQHVSHTVRRDRAAARGREYIVADFALLHLTE